MLSSIHLQNSQIAVEVVPELGGKIASLIDRTTGREWLWKNPHLKQRSPNYGESYIEHLDFGGWDEMFPSVSPVQLSDGTDIPDHGELVALPAEVTRKNEHSLSIATQTRAISARFTRTLSLEGSTLRVQYLLESEHPTPIPYLWATHPLFALESGMTLEIPNGQFVQPPDPNIDVQELPDGRCLLQLHDPETDIETKGVAQKLFIPCKNTSEIMLRSATDSSLKLTWNAQAAPYLGLWINLRGWSGCGSKPYSNLGIEPTTAPFDSLLDAIQCNQHQTLPPFSKQEWSLQLSLQS